MACPERVLVELKMFVRDTPKKHSAEAAISDRKGFDPFLSWLFVPERERGIGGENGLAQRDDK